MKLTEKFKRKKCKYQSKFERESHTFSKHVVFDLQNCKTNHLSSISRTSIVSFPMEGSACNIQSKSLVRLRSSDTRKKIIDSTAKKPSAASQVHQLAF